MKKASDYYLDEECYTCQYGRREKVIIPMYDIAWPMNVIKCQFPEQRNWIFEYNHRCEYYVFGI